jgi:hypothetical protein
VKFFLIHEIVQFHIVLMVVLVFLMLMHNQCVFVQVILPVNISLKTNKFNKNFSFSSGLYCQTYSNPCSLVICIQGTCVMLVNSTYLCLCPIVRSGRNREIVDPCLITSGTSATCRNGGTFIRLTDTSYCIRLY